MIASKGCERLYLQKDDVKTIHIDLQQLLPQHQIDGIRFLHKQYKKEAPGVILNDPSGYGKCLQVTLFISAMQPALKKPVLILSDSLANWKEHFENWTGCSNEVVIESSNPFTKQLIKINPIKDGHLFSRRSWGIVVLHDEDCSHELLSLRFNADFKIWIIRDDLKENLYTLASIYEWLHPNQKFNVAVFTAERDSKRDIIEKAILLDAFLEDFLIRRTDFDVPFEKPECHKRVPKRPTSATVTRKNKDPTGTKVKRSKKNTIEDDENETNDYSSSAGSKIVKTTNIYMRSNDNNMDVEEFIRDEEPISCDEFNFLQDSSRIAKIRKNKDPTGTKVKRSKINGNTDGNVSYLNSRTEVSSVTFGSTEICNSESNDDERLDQSNIERSISDETSHNSEDSSFTVTVNVPTSSNIKFEDIDSFINNDSKKKDTDKDSSSVLRYTETDVPVEDTPQSSNIIDVKESTVIVPDTEEIESSNAVTIQKDSEVQEISIMIPETEPEENSNGVDNNKLIKEEKPSMTEKIDIENLSNNNKISNEVSMSSTNQVDDLDAKLAEMEAKALQRLKNSILDSLF